MYNPNFAAVTGPAALVNRLASAARLTAALALTLIPHAAAAQSFAARIAYPVGKEPFEVIAHDLNGDSIPDLATANSFDGNLSVMLGGGSPFRQATHYSIAEGAHTNSRSLVAADFNGDGKPDIAVSNYVRHSVTVFRGSGDGTFAKTGDFEVSGNPYSVAAGDFNGDGKQDLVVGNQASNNVSLLVGNGDGTFKAEAKFAAGGGPVWASVGDFNGDAKPDLAVSNYYSDSLSVLAGNGDGTFKPAISYAVGSFPLVNRAADLNGDGILDLFVANPFSPFVTQSSKNSVSVLIGNGDGTFKAAAHYPVASDPRSVAAADLNGDGRADLATANYNSGTVSVIAGNGDGTFRAAVDLPAGAKPVSILAGDLNGDGRADLAVSNSVTDAPAVGVMLNQTGAFSISGTVRAGDGTALEGVTIVLGGAASAVAATGADGSYQFRSLSAGGGYTVTPSKFNLTFAPASRSFANLSADETADFVGVAPPYTPPPTPTPAPTPYPDFTISGRVTNPAGAALADVMVSVSGNQTGTQVGFTDAAGNYSFRYAPDFGLIMTPSKSGYNFSPSAAGPVSSNFISGNVVVNFTGTPSSLTLVSPPVLLTVPFTSRALTFDSVTMMREPFALAKARNFSADGRTRLMLFAARAKPAVN